jgi:hypothetical protein
MSKPLVLQILVPGTASGSSIFSNKDSNGQTFKENVAKSYQSQGYDVIQKSFDWDQTNKSDIFKQPLNGVLNQQRDRSVAANSLAAELKRSLQTLKVEGKLPKDLRVSLVAHSHGGNVSIQSLKYMKQIAKDFNVNLTIDLVNLNTPTYTNKEGANYQTVSQANGNMAVVPTGTKLNTEDPSAYNNIATLGNNVKLNHLNIQLQSDSVPGIAMGGKSYNNGKTNDVLYTTDSIAKPKDNKIIKVARIVGTIVPLVKDGVAANDIYNQASTIVPLHNQLAANASSKESQDVTNNVLPNFINQNKMNISPAAKPTQKLK